MAKVCKKCEVGKPLEDFPKHPECRDGRKGVCKVCTYAGQKARSKSGGAISQKKYRKTPRGYIMQTYRNMLSRVRGWIKPHLYSGLDIVPREEFYAWALADGSEFFPMLEAYIASGLDMRLAPSIDRRDTSLGYTLDNIRWLTHSENSSLGGMNK